MTDKEWVIERCKKCIDSGFGEENLMFYYKVLKVAREKELGDWISVTDRLPENEQKVLAYWNWHSKISEGTDIAICKYDDMKWYDLGYDVFIDKEGFSNVTHWMPLPEPPEEANDADMDD